MEEEEKKIVNQNISAHTTCYKKKYYKFNIWAVMRGRSFYVPKLRDQIATKNDVYSIDCDIFFNLILIYYHQINKYK